MSETNLLIVLSAFVLSITWMLFGFFEQLTTSSTLFAVVFPTVAVGFWVLQLRCTTGIQAMQRSDSLDYTKSQERQSSAFEFASHHTRGSFPDQASLRVGLSDFNATRINPANAENAFFGRLASLLAWWDPLRSRRFTWLVNMEIDRLVREHTVAVRLAQKVDKTEVVTP